MKSEFSAKEDVKQACREAQIDVRMVAGHLGDLAGRMEKHFPEIAEGLRGARDGMLRLSDGIDGEWETAGNFSLKRLLPAEHFATHMWAYELSREPSLGVLLLGAAGAIAARHPDMTYWAALTEAKKVFDDLVTVSGELHDVTPRTQTTQ